MKNKLLTAAVVSVIAFMSTVGMNANAASIDDLVAKARAYGIPESAIQSGLNQYYQAPGTYDIDLAMEYLDQYHDEILAELVGQTPTSEPATESDKTESSSSSGGSQETASDSTQASSGNSQTTTSPTFERVDKDDFINMSLEEKQNYIASLDEQQRDDFLNSLSAEELKSVVKQLPANDKAGVIDKFVQAGGALGVNVTIDEITDDNFSMEMRDNEGNLIDKGSLGAVVEDTGISYRKLYLISASCIAAAAAGIFFVFRKYFSKKKAG